MQDQKPYLKRMMNGREGAYSGTILLQDAALPEEHAFKVSAAAVLTYNGAFNFSFFGFVLLQKLPLLLHLRILKRKTAYVSRHFPSDFLSVKGNIQ